MDILLISGFLGSGKTTVLLEMIHQLKGIYAGITILENEVGEIGVDGKYLKNQGLNVQELFGGCICCTLQNDMVETLKVIESLYYPSLTVIEATGIAKPKDIVNLLKAKLDFISDVKIITIVDAMRYNMLLEMLGELLTAQIAFADLIALNKIDAIADDRLPSMISSIRHINQNAKIASISAENKMNTASMVEALYG